MGRKNTHNWAIIDSEDMSADITSDSTDVTNTDNIGIIVSWTGTSPVGELFVQVSNDNGTPTTWVNLDFGAAINISGNSGSHDISINQLPYSKLRLFYNRTSGSGSLVARLTQKQVGG